MLFDAYIFVDWSARHGPSPPRPSADAVWIGEGRADRPGAAAVYCRTRLAAYNLLLRRLTRHMAAGMRVLVGFDLPYGYPAGFAAAMGLNGDAPPWRLTWSAITDRFRDDAANLNNRFQVASELNALCSPDTPGPFWCAPLKHVTPTLPWRRQGFVEFPYRLPDGGVLEALRLCDARLIAAGLQVHTVWQLLGTGSVGGQGIAGIPYVQRLRDHPTLAGASRVWPFETGFTRQPTPESGPFILHVEIWPRVAETHLNPRVRIRDRAQVLSMVEWARALDSQGRLADLFGPPAGLSPDRIRAAIEEEGWILGAP